MMKKKITEENLQTVIDSYNQLRSLDAVSKKLAISIPTIHRALKEAGINTSLDRKLLGERIRKYELDPYYFSKIDTRDKAYIMGILHSDGCITRGTKQVRLKLTDVELLEEINSKIYKERIPYYSEAKGNNKRGATMVITHEQIFQDVQKHGCCFDKSYFLEFPTTIPDELMGDYFRGMFDGDGCVYVNKNLSYKPANVTIVATNNWVNGAIEYLLTKNIRGSNYQDKRHDQRVGRLTLKDVTSIKLFYEFIYKDLENQIYLKRKFETYTENILLRQTFDKFDRNFDTTEIFKKIKGYENYEIGNKGSVKSLRVNDTILIRPTPMKSGYRMVTLDGTKFLVRRLVAEAFLQNLDADNQILKNINGNVSDDRVENLQWVKRKYPKRIKASK